MQSKRLASILILAVAQALIGCGYVIKPAYSSLNGNWLLTGNRQSKQYPFISLALIVDGDQITAKGTMVVGCGNSPATAASSGFSLNGQIGSDGNFQLREPAFAAHNSIQVSIDGHLGMHAEWTGTYSITSLPT